VDYGRRRIGLAVCDPLGITVRALPTLAAGRDPEESADRTADVLSAEGVEAVVVGLPLHADGRESEMSGEARRFASRLGERLGVPVFLRDEGLSSWEAEQILRERGVPPEKARRQGLVDQESAKGLLRAWLDAGRPAGGQPDPA
jgi:putative Holliday junction resolvase